MFFFLTKLPRKTIFSLVSSDKVPLKNFPSVSLEKLLAKSFFSPVFAQNIVKKKFFSFAFEKFAYQKFFARFSSNNCPRKQFLFSGSFHFSVRLFTLKNSSKIEFTINLWFSSIIYCIRRLQANAFLSFTSILCEIRD